MKAVQHAMQAILSAIEKIEHTENSKHITQKLKAIYKELNDTLKYRELRNKVALPKK